MNEVGFCNYVYKIYKINEMTSVKQGAIYVLKSIVLLYNIIWMVARV